MDLLECYIFPFGNVSDSEFIHATTNSDVNSVNFDLNSVLLSRNAPSDDTDFIGDDTVFSCLQPLAKTAYITTEEISCMNHPRIP